MAVLYSNNASSTLSASITSTATSLSVASGAGALFPAPSGSDYFYITLVNSAGAMEIMKVTARSADTLTVVRGQDGTTGVAWAAGDRVELRFTRAMLDDIKGERMPAYGPSAGSGGRVMINLSGNPAWSDINFTYDPIMGQFRAIGLRANMGDSAPTWNFNNILHAGNYSSYALPLGGGTLTGTLNINSNDGVKAMYEGADSTWYRGWGMESDRITVYVRPTANATQSLRIGYSEGTQNWLGVRVDANTFTHNGYTVLNANNYTSYAASASHTHNYMPLGSDSTFSDGVHGGSINGTNMQALLAPNQITNQLAFNAPTSYEYWNGSAWVAGTIPTNIFAGKSSGAFGGFDIPNGRQKIRFTWLNYGYRYWRSIATAGSTNGNGFKLRVYKSSDGTNWTNSFTDSDFRGDWPGYHVYTNQDSMWGFSHLRLEFEFSWNNGNACNFGDIAIWGAYGGYTPLFNWDYSRNVEFFGQASFQRNDLQRLIASYNTSAGSPLQFYIDHSYGDVNIGNDRGALKIQGHTALNASNYSSYALPLSGGVVYGTGYFRKNQTAGDYTTAALWTESYGNTSTGIAFHISGVAGRYLEMRNNSANLFWNGSVILNDGNYTNYRPPLLAPTNVTSTSASTWNPQGFPYQAWGQAFVHSSLSNDSGDITYWLRAANGGTELCVTIDGDYYAGTGQHKVLHAGNYTNYSTFAGKVVSSGNNGFANDVYYGGVRNPIWSFGNAPSYGISYYQGSAGIGGVDAIGFSVNGTTSVTSNNFAISASASYVNNNVVLHAGNYTNYVTGGSHNHNRIAWVDLRAAESGTTYNTPVGYMEMVGAYNNGWPNQYGNVLSMNGGGASQLYMGWFGGSGAETGELYYRSMTDWRTNWGSWRRILTSANWSEYAAPVSHTHNYVLKTGDTMTGRLTIDGSGWTTNNRNYSNEWIEFGNFSGLYSPNNGAHFYPNNGSYGSWRSAGSRNGWAGIEFDASNGQVVLMINPDSNTSGFHNNSYGWQFRWNNGTAYVYKSAYGGGTSATVLDSSNYTNYTLPTGGSWYGTGLPGSRYLGIAYNGGEFVLGNGLPNANQMGVLIDGCYVAGENNGFWSMGADNTWGSRRGMYWDGSYLRFDLGSPVSKMYALTVGNWDFYENSGGWNANIIAAGIYHGRVRVKASSYNSSGDQETYMWVDNTVNPATGIYSTKSTLNFNGSITTVQVAFNTVLHAGNYSNYAAPASHTHSYLPLSGGTLASTSDGILTLNKSSGTGWGYINFSQAGTRRFYFGLNASFEPELGTDNGGTFRVIGNMTVGGNQVIHAGNISSYAGADTGAKGNIQIFNASGTFTVPAGITKLRITAFGGGGGGATTYAWTGGSGGCGIALVTVTPGTTYTVTIGAGGRGYGQAGASQAGGTTSFGTLVTATGGLGSYWQGQPPQGGTFSTTGTLLASSKLTGNNLSFWGGADGSTSYSYIGAGGGGMHGGGGSAGSVGGNSFYGAKGNNGTGNGAGTGGAGGSVSGGAAGGAGGAYWSDGYSTVYGAGGGGAGGMIIEW